MQEMQEEIGKGMHECMQESMPRRMALEDGGKSVCNLDMHRRRTRGEFKHQRKKYTAKE
jgi:hypothetical protein